jgi:hypothetical protein
VNGDEQQFVVLWTIGEWTLQGEQLIDLEIGRVGDSFLVICRRH